MSPSVVLRSVTTGTGVVLLVLNLLHLGYGIPRLRSRIAAGEVSAGLATPFVVAWLYVGLAGLAFGCLLVVIAPDVAAGNPVARRVAITVSLTLIVFGVAAFAAARSHPGLLLISLFGVAVLLPVLIYRPHFVS